MKKLFNMKVCLTSPISIMIIVALLFSTIVIASAVKNGEEIKEVIPNNKEEVWIPTEEDIAYQDSMFNIISANYSCGILKDTLFHNTNQYDHFKTKFLCMESGHFKTQRASL